MANPIVDVNASTILQRKTDDEVMGRVFGALDTALIGAMALGSAIMPLMIHFWGLQWSLAILAIAGLRLGAAGLRSARGLDATLREPEGLVLLRQVPLFAPLEPKSLERIAQQLVRIEVPAGEVLIREGDEGDRFYVIESGQMTATLRGRGAVADGSGRPVRRDRAAARRPADGDGHRRRADRSCWPWSARTSSTPSPATARSTTAPTT